MIAVESLNGVLESCTPLDGYAGTVTLASLASRISRLYAVTATPVRDLVVQLADDLADDIPGALWQPLTFACVWTDLARLAGVEPPAEVAALAYGDTLELVTH